MSAAALSFRRMRGRTGSASAVRGILAAICLALQMSTGSTLPSQVHRVGEFALPQHRAPRRLALVSDVLLRCECWYDALTSFAHVVRRDCGAITWVLFCVRSRRIVGSCGEERQLLLYPRGADKFIALGCPGSSIQSPRIFYTLCVRKRISRIRISQSSFLSRILRARPFRSSTAGRTSALECRPSSPCMCSALARGTPISASSALAMDFLA